MDLTVLARPNTLARRRYNQRYDTFTFKFVSPRNMFILLLSLIYARVPHLT